MVLLTTICLLLVAWKPLSLEHTPRLDRSLSLASTRRYFGEMSSCICLGNLSSSALGDRGRMKKNVILCSMFSRRNKRSSKDQNVTKFCREISLSSERHQLPRRAGPSSVTRSRSASSPRLHHRPILRQRVGLLGRTHNKTRQGLFVEPSSSVSAGQVVGREASTTVPLFESPSSRTLLGKKDPRQ